jgi:hypothetical protein
MQPAINAPHPSHEPNMQQHMTPIQHAGDPRVDITHGGIPVSLTAVPVGAQLPISVATVNVNGNVNVTNVINRANNNNMNNSMMMLHAPHINNNANGVNGADLDPAANAVVAAVQQCIISLLRPVF